MVVGKFREVVCQLGDVGKMYMFRVEVARS